MKYSQIITGTAITILAGLGSYSTGTKKLLKRHFFPQRIKGPGFPVSVRKKPTKRAFCYFKRTKGCPLPTGVEMRAAELREGRGCSAPFQVHQGGRPTPQLVLSQPQNQSDAGNRMVEHDPQNVLCPARELTYKHSMGDTS